MFKLEQDDPKLVDYVKSRLLMKTGTSSGQVSATCNYTKNVRKLYEKNNIQLTD